MSDNAPEIVTRIRAMEDTDLPLVAHIERMSYPYPWPVWFFLYALRTGASCWVLERNGIVRGYGVMRIRRGWAHIMNLCVAPGYRERGLGRKLMNHLLTVAAGKGASRAWLEVRPDNRQAIGLYLHMGFRIKHRHRGYYPSPRGRLDALVMMRQLAVQRPGGRAEAATHGG